MAMTNANDHTDQQSGSGFQKRLGLFDATMLVAGTMIGSGIFIVSADIARDVGSSGWLMLVWIITGVMTIFGALSYAELAAMMPRAGGQYVYLREAYTPMWGFLYGWTCFVVIQTGSIAAVGVAFAKFLGVLAPNLGTDNILYAVEDLNWKLDIYVPWMGESLTFFERQRFTISAGQIVAVVVIAFLTYLNTKGVQEGKIVQNIFTIAKTLGLILLIVAGFTIAFSPQATAVNQADVWGGISGTDRFQKVSSFIPWAPLAIVLVVCGAMVGSLFSADAWNNITFTAGEIRNPRRNLPWSLGLGVGMVIVLYLLANMSFMTALPVQGNVEETHALESKLRSRQAEVMRELSAQAQKEASALAQRAELERAKKDRQPQEQLDALLKRIEQSETQAAEHAKKATQLEAAASEVKTEAAFARGIDNAREDRIGTAVLERASPNLGVPLMAIAIMISTFGCVNGMILMGARLYYAMGQDRLFFQSVGRLNPQGVPAVGLVLQGVWSILLVFSGSYIELLDYVIFAVLFFYVLTVIGLFRLRRKYPNAVRPYRAFGYPVIPGLYVLMCAVICIALLIVRPVYSWPSFILLLLGIPVYFLWPGKDAGQREGVFEDG